MVIEYRKNMPNNFASFVIVLLAAGMVVFFPSSSAEEEDPATGKKKIWSCIYFFLTTKTGQVELQKLEFCWLHLLVMNVQPPAKERLYYSKLE